MTTSDQYPEIAAIARRALMEAVRKEIAGKTKEWFAPAVEKKKQEIIDSGQIIYTKERLEDMGAKLIQTMGNWYNIIQLNPTTVTHSWMHGSTLKTRYSEIQKVICVRKEEKIGEAESRRDSIEGKKRKIINGGHIIYTKERLEDMGAKLIETMGDWHNIIRLNPTTVTHSWFHGSTLKTRYSEIQAVLCSKK